MAAPAEARIVLLGKTGSGKSRAGNVILGEEKFEFVCKPNSVTTDCQTEERNLNGRKITVTDTPGIFDTERSEADLKHSIISCLTECAPGPHAFILVLRVGRYTEEEQKSVTMILKYFQKETLKHTAVLFTHGDELEENQTIKEFVEMNKHLKELVDKCDGRVHVIDSKYWKDENIDQEYRSNSFQIKQLLTTIDNMVKEKEKGNECPYYTNESLQLIAKSIQDEVHTIIQERREQFLEEAKNRVIRENIDSYYNNTDATEHKKDKIIKEKNTEIQKEARERIIDKISKSEVAGAAVGSLLGLLLGAPVGVAVPFVILAGLLTAGVKSIKGSRSNDQEVNPRSIRVVETVADVSSIASGVARAATVAGATTAVELVAAAGVYAIAGAITGGIAGAQAGETCVDTTRAAKEAAKAAGQTGISTLKDVWDATQNLARSKESPDKKHQ